MYDCARLAAATTSFARMRQSLSGTHGLCENAISEFPSNHPWSRKIDPTPEELLELTLHTGQLKISNRVIELGDEVHVAIWSRIIPRNRSKYKQRGYPKTIQLVSMTR